MTAPAQRPDRPTRYPGERSRWMVPSSDPNEPDYLVDMDDEEVGFWCACPDWHFRQKELGPHYKCKHILAVEADERRQALEVIKRYDEMQKQTAK